MNVYIGKLPFSTTWYSRSVRWLRSNAETSLLWTLCTALSSIFAIFTAFSSIAPYTGDVFVERIAIYAEKVKHYFPTHAVSSEKNFLLFSGAFFLKKQKEKRKVEKEEINRLTDESFHHRQHVCHMFFYTGDMPHTQGDETF